MGSKVNLVLDEQVKAELDRLVPVGQKSRFANDAIAAHLELLRRRKAAEALEAFRRSGPFVSTEEVVQLIREGRDGP